MTKLPLQRCIKIAYLDRVSAQSASRRVRSRVPKVGDIKTEFCEPCKKYHLKSETYPPIRRWRDMVILAAQGFRYHEIAKTLGVTHRTVRHAMYQMQRDWGALNCTHLIITLTHYGVLEPSEYLFLDDGLERYRTKEAS